MRFVSRVSVFALLALGALPASLQAQTYAPQAYAQPSSSIVARTPLSDSDSANMRAALSAAQRGDLAAIRSARDSMQNPVARKIALWALVDVGQTRLSFLELDSARRDLAGWPRGARRQENAERLLETGGLGPQATIDWFGGADPATAEGAMALASAYRSVGRASEARELIRRIWRGKAFGSDPQRSMQARFGDALTVDDHIARVDMLLYGSQMSAARDLIPLLPADRQVLAQARLALRLNQPGANDLVSAVPTNLQGDPGLAFERAAFYRRANLETLAYGLLPRLTTPAPDSAADRIWDERQKLVLSALKNGNAANAYRAAADSGLTTGGDAAEAEFYAGWIALTKLKNPSLAARHFANLDEIGSSPITQSRASYWRGRAAEAMGDVEAARAFYEQGAEYPTAFYGQLCVEKAGQGIISLGRDPQITPSDRQRFEGREAVQAARMLMEIGAKDQYRAFVAYLDDYLPNAAEEALLVDLVRGYGDPMLAMTVVRAAAQRGFILPERGYPLRTPPSVEGAPETAFVLGITRQESSFDPMARSGADARGMMQMLPSTASIVARQVGVPYSAAQLYDADYNMRLGAYHLGDLTRNFSGSYIMAAAAYNAGPGRPRQWVGVYGDPRTASTDPLDFIESIPFSETRNYVMRVMENMMVYRARLNGGSTPATLSMELARGRYGYSMASQP